MGASNRERKQRQRSAGILRAAQHIASGANRCGETAQLVEVLDSVGDRRLYEFMYTLARCAEKGGSDPFYAACDEIRQIGLSVK